jgi:hypothetical protein
VKSIEAKRDGLVVTAVDAAAAAVDSTVGLGEP